MPEGSSTAEERLVKRVIARFRCERCNRQHAIENVNVMGKYEAVWVVGVACDGCQRPGMFVVSMRKDSSFDRVTDLTEEEQERFLVAQSVGADDVEGIKAFLRDFKGNFSAIFGKREG
ncbi:MAG TPA: hypothetical protein VMW62_19145 [Chloroflexota bacterium]|nr:hypothetical protein [Chloroflexota bacterium]